MFKEERLYRFFCYSLVFIIFLNAIFNILFGDKSNSFDEINFFDIFAGLLLFIYLYAVGNSLKNLLRFDNVSLGITFYLFSFFIFDCIILFFYQKLSFLEILLIVNFLWLSVFILKLKSLKNVLSILIPFISLRLFIEEFNSKLTINNNIRGDVEAVFFD